RMAQGNSLNTDDRTLLEYHAPRSLLAHGLSDANEALINSVRAGPLPSNLESSDANRALKAGVATALDLGDTGGAQRFLSSNSEPSAERYIAQGRLALMQLDLSTGKSAFEAALKLNPDSLEAMHWLAVVEHRSENQTAASSLIDQILKRNPQY